MVKRDPDKDYTVHDDTKHTAPIPIPEHTAEWYREFGNKCPTCGAPSEGSER